MLPAAQPSWPPTGWLTRKQAAERLKLSDSRVAALGGGADPKRGEIRTSGQKSPYSGQNCTLYHAGDVERMAFERENPPLRDSVEALAAAGFSNEFLARASRVPVTLKEETAPPRLWLTIEESAAYLGLPPSIIQKLAESGKLPALDCGPRPGGKWRVKRSDLDAFEGDR